MQRLEISCAVRRLYRSLGVIGLNKGHSFRRRRKECLPEWFPHSCSDSGNRSRNLNLPALYACRRKECLLFNSAGAYGDGWLRRIDADSLSLTVHRNDFLILVPTLGIGVGTWICMHYTRTLTMEHTCSTCIKCHFGTTRPQSLNRVSEYNAVVLHVPSHLGTTRPQSLNHVSWNTMHDEYSLTVCYYETDF